jgi:hypothetical protein
MDLTSLLRTEVAAAMAVALAILQRVRGFFGLRA